ncbi:hypothetical protein IFM12275_10190 [Nocardia sputorum]|uniref:Uncharacterized protein n=1 Tax=Nocardia sputorum TaxID=2984338 RepID=A0ABN6U3S6_9NOCA|nr:hypothetical protein IFM12275_10190 [Nocardia sputorum]BDT99675.1 hypothetical protein IFM12276_27040 [Nocardia sputorum]
MPGEASEQDVRAVDPGFPDGQAAGLDAVAVSAGLMQQHSPVLVDDAAQGGSGAIGDVHPVRSRVGGPAWMTWPACVG